MTAQRRQEIRLAAIARYATRYEWTLSHPDGRMLLLGYLRPIQRGARDYIRGLQPNEMERLRAAFVAGYALDGYDRTQREAILGGERP